MIIEKDEATAARRRVPFRLFTSNGTAPDTGASNDSIAVSVNGASEFTTCIVSAISAAAGMYYTELAQSNVSTLGVAVLWHYQGDFPQHVANVQIVNNNPMSTLSALSNVTLHAGAHSSVTIQGLSNYANISNVTLHAGTHSGATVQGLSNYANISNVTLHAGLHSNVTIQGVTRVNSGVTLNANTHSGATVQGLSNYANISAVTLHEGVHSGATVAVNDIAPKAYSGVSVEIKTGGIQASSHGAGAIDAAAVSTDAGQEIADRFLLRSIEAGADSGRSVGQALAALRNRVLISGSTGTVYLNDDSTSMWTFSVATTDAMAITEIDPGGA